MMKNDFQFSKAGNTRQELREKKFALHCDESCRDDEDGHRETLLKLESKPLFRYISNSVTAS